MTDTYSIFAQDLGGGGLMGMLTTIIIIALAINVFYIVVGWKVYEKAGKPGWATLIPIYNLVVFLDIIGKPPIWILWLIIPCTAPIFAILAMIELAKVFGKDTGFAIGLIFLGFIFYPILAFGDAKYIGPQQPQQPMA